MSFDIPEYFNGPFLKKNKISYRHYQSNIINKCKNRNSLIVLPTGLGKTIIGILQVANCLKKYELRGKVIILAPTRPLVAQHKLSCEKFLEINPNAIALLTGHITPKNRVVLFNKSKVIISTPQVIKNDLLRGRYDLDHVSLIIFDEAHRTKGNYAYNFISKEYINSCTDPLILGLTASPGKDYNHIQKISDNLYIENIVFKTVEDYDVKEYINEIDVFLERINLPIKILEICEIWNHLFNKFLKFFTQRNLINPHKSYYSKLDFLRISHDLTLSLRYENSLESTVYDDDILKQLHYISPKIIDIVKANRLDIHSIFSYCSSCISLLHAKELLETQDTSLFKSFLERLIYKAGQEEISAKRIVNSKHFQFISSLLQKESEMDLAHPKIEKLISIINEEVNEFQNNRIIVFTQYRAMAELLKQKLSLEFSGKLVVEKFIGQTTKIDDIGYPQYKQIDILNEFRENLINILIATSVAEEGLDIPNVDAIIFYEPIPSEIRTIQRRGRTGRVSSGRCYILLTENTVDIPFYIVAKRKEDTMNSVLRVPEQLELKTNLERKRIEFSSSEKKYSELDIIKDFNKRREKEKLLLANRSIEEILTEIDSFAKSSVCKKFRDLGLTFYSDLIRIDELKLEKNVLKLKGDKISRKKKPQRYLNKNVKTLINIAKNYNTDGKIEFSKFQALANQEDITDKKFNIHFNHACYLGFLKRDGNHVCIVKSKS